MSPFAVGPPANRPRVTAILLGGFIGFLAGQIIALLLEGLAVSLDRFPGGLSALAKLADPPWWSNVLGLVGLWCGFAGAIYFAYREGQLSWLEHQWRPRPSDLGYVLVGVAAQFIIDALYAPFHLKNLNGPSNHLFRGAHGTGFVVVGLLTIFVAPIFEEWLFRGVLFRALAEGVTSLSSRGALVLGVIGSAVLFGLAHGEWEQFAGLALFGVLLALIFHRARRLVPSYLTHASFNATAFIAIIVQRAGHS